MADRSYIMGIDMAVPGSEKTIIRPYACYSCANSPELCGKLSQAMADSRKWQDEKAPRCWVPDGSAWVESDCSFFELVH